MSYHHRNNVLKTSIMSCTLAGVLLITGCDKTIDNEADNDPDTAAVIDMTKSNVQDDLVMTKITLDTVDKILFVPLINSGDLSAKQVTCLEARDKNLGKAEVDEFYKSQFSVVELQELDTFYTSEIGEKLLAFGSQQLQMMNGEQIANPIPEPSEAEMTEIQAFMQSPVGAKYMQINNAEGAGSAMEILNTPIEAELKRCNIDMDSTEPM